MRKQKRPFIVEVKQKRSSPKKGRSIWGNLDIAAVAAETTRDLERNELISPRLIDSGAASIDVASNGTPPIEHKTPEPQEAETTETVVEASTDVEAPEPKNRVPKPKKAKAPRKPRIGKEAVYPAPKAADALSPPSRGKRKSHSKRERAQKLAQIEKTIDRGVPTKNAVGEAGISGQTYDQWRKTSETHTPADDLKDLLALEEENKRLKKLLAERLRQENAMLRKKLRLK